LHGLMSTGVSCPKQNQPGGGGTLQLLLPVRKQPRGWPAAGLDPGAAAGTATAAAAAGWDLVGPPCAQME
jgi:hypothetical protein